MSSTARNLHVPLDPLLYASLMAEARRTGCPATQVARQAIERLLEQRRKEEIERELAEYVQEMAGTTADLDPALQAAGIEQWLGRAARKRGKK